MKEYIYKDTSFMNSIISQHHGGLKSTSSIVEESSSTDEQEETITSPGTSFSGSLGFPSVASAQVTGQAKTSSTRTNEALTESKQLINDLLVLDAAYENLEEIILQYNSFEIETDEYNLIDFNALKSLMSSDYLKKSIIDDKIKESSESVQDNLNREQRRNYSKEIRQNEEKLKKSVEDSYESILQAIELILGLLPSNLVLVNSNYDKLFPLSTDKLILDTKQVSLYYKNIETSVLYKKIGTLEESLKQEIQQNRSSENASFVDINNATSALIQYMYKIIGIDQDAVLCMPITWYQNHELEY